MVLDPKLKYEEKKAELEAEMEEVEPNSNDWFRIRSEIRVLDRNIAMVNKMKRDGMKW